MDVGCWDVGSLIVDIRGIGIQTRCLECIATVQVSGGGAARTLCFRFRDTLRRTVILNQDHYFITFSLDYVHTGTSLHIDR